MGKYTDTPTQTVIRLANSGDRDACLELSIRYSTGTYILEKNPQKAEYWRKQSIHYNESSYSYSTSSSIDSSDSIKNDTYSMTTGLFNEKINMQNKKYDWAITPDKNKHQWVIGIDFGHGETSAACCLIDWDKKEGTLGKVVDINMGHNKKKMPSLMSFLPDGRIFTGENAVNSLNNISVESCFKKKPEEISGEKEQLMICFMREVYKEICKNHPEWHEKHLVYIATPSGWDNEAINLYGQMARKAGLPIAGITTESRAAFIHKQCDPTSGLPQYIDKGAVIFDLGSSTLDFTYICDNKKPLDYGYNCGASQIENIMYEEARKQNKDITAFESKYPRQINTLLYKVRERKEQYYFSPNFPVLRPIFIEEINDDKQFEDTKIRINYQPGELNQLLKEKGYIEEIRKALLDYRENRISGKPIYAVFLTGGASRMNFVKNLITECWNIPEENIYCDEEPSLTISQGITELARMDLRTNIATILKELSNKCAQIDIYTPFTYALEDKVWKEILNTIRYTMENFKNSSNDASINGLQTTLKANIDRDLSRINIWATECFQKALNEKTHEIQKLAEDVVKEYSREQIHMGKPQLTISSVSSISTDMISMQINQIADLFKDGLMKDLIAYVGNAIGGATLAYLVAIFMGGPLMWLLAIGGLVGALLGNRKSDEEKKQEALAKKLDKKERQKVYEEFNKEWQNISTEIYRSVVNAIRYNANLRKTIQSQSQYIIESFVKECIKQTRITIE